MKAYKENCTMAILALFTLSHSLGAKACTPSVTKLLRRVSPCHVKYGVTKLCLVVGRDKRFLELENFLLVGFSPLLFVPVVYGKNEEMVSCT